MALPDGCINHVFRVCLRILLCISSTIIVSNGARYRHMQVLPHCDSLECYAPLLKPNCHYISVLYPSKQCMCTKLKCDHKKPYLFPTPAPISDSNGFPVYPTNIFTAIPYTRQPVAYSEQEFKVHKPRIASSISGRNPPAKGGGLRSKTKDKPPFQALGSNYGWRSNFVKDRGDKIPTIPVNRNRQETHENTRSELSQNPQQRNQGWDEFRPQSISYKPELRWNNRETRPNLPIPRPNLPKPPLYPSESRSYVLEDNPRRRIFPKQRTISSAQFNAASPSIKPTLPAPPKYQKSVSPPALKYKKAASLESSVPIHAFEIREDLKNQLIRSFLTSSEPKISFKPEYPFHEKRYSDAPPIYDDKDRADVHILTNKNIELWPRYFQDKLSSSKKSDDYEPQTWVTWKPNLVQFAPINTTPVPERITPKQGPRPLPNHVLRINPRNNNDRERRFREGNLRNRNQNLRESSIKPRKTDSKRPQNSRNRNENLRENRQRLEFEQNQRNTQSPSRFQSRTTSDPIFDTSIIDFKKINVEKALLVDRLRNRVLKSRLSRNRNAPPINEQSPNLNWIVNRRLQRNYERRLQEESHRKQIRNDLSDLRKKSQTHATFPLQIEDESRLRLVSRESLPVKKFGFNFDDLKIDELYFEDEQNDEFQQVSPFPTPAPPIFRTTTARVSTTSTRRPFIAIPKLRKSANLISRRAKLIETRFGEKRRKHKSSSLNNSNYVNQFLRRNYVRPKGVPCQSLMLLPISPSNSLIKYLCVLSPS